MIQTLSMTKPNLKTAPPPDPLPRSHREAVQDVKNLREWVETLKRDLDDDAERLVELRFPRNREALILELSRAKTDTEREKIQQQLANEQQAETERKQQVELLEETLDVRRRELAAAHRDLKRAGNTLEQERRQYWAGVLQAEEKDLQALLMDTYRRLACLRIMGGSVSPDHGYKGELVSYQWLHHREIAALNQTKYSLAAELEAIENT